MSGSAGDMNATVVDSHHHFWRLERRDYTWLTPDMNALYRDFEPQHLTPLLSASHVHRTILVQAAPTLDETRFLLSLARQNEFIAAVIGWVDFEDPRVDESLDEFCQYEHFRGVRPMVQDIADPNWLLRSGVDRAVSALIERGLTFDALIRPIHIGILQQFCTRHPKLTVIVDHAAKPAIATQSFKTWAADMRQLSRNTEVRCKLSGLVTEAGCADAAVLAPYVEHLLECFGPTRLMWGSDWPVCESVCSYGEWLDLSQQLLAHLSSTDRAAVFGGVADETYRLERAAVPRQVLRVSS